MSKVKSTRRRPAQARSKVTVEAILEATAQILLTEGADRLSTNRIAVRAGVSIGSLYQYFSSKEAIVSALAQRHLEGERAVILAALAGISDLEPADFPALAHRLIKGIFQAHQHEPQLHEALMRVMPDDSLSATKSTIATAVGMYLTEYSQHFRITDPELAAFIVVELIEAAIHRATLSRPDLLEDDRLVDALADAVVRYLMA
ncbi:MAG: AcrR family transcriptional regulator [Myxococcota bacterium]